MEAVRHVPDVQPATPNAETGLMRRFRSFDPTASSALSHASEGEKPMFKRPDPKATAGKRRTAGTKASGTKNGGGKPEEGDAEDHSKSKGNVYEGVRT